MQVAERQPVAFWCSETAYANCQVAVGDFCCAEVQVTTCAIGNGATGHSARNKTNDIAIIIKDVAIFTKAVNTRFSIFLRDNILARRHHVVVGVVQIKLTSIELIVVVFIVAAGTASAEQSIEGHHVDTVWHLGKRLIEVECADSKSTENMHIRIATMTEGDAIGFCFPSLKAINKGRIYQQTCNLGTSSDATCDGIREHLVYEINLSCKCIVVQVEHIHDVCIGAVRIVSARLQRFLKISLKELSPFACYFVCSYVIDGIIASLHIFLILRNRLHDAFLQLG